MQTSLAGGHFLNRCGCFRFRQLTPKKFQNDSLRFFLREREYAAASFAEPEMLDAMRRALFLLS